jgi:MFS family permease
MTTTETIVSDESKKDSRAKEYGMARKALTAVNFFVETNRLEHYAAVYLVEIMKWRKIDFGIVSLVMNVAMVIFQTPAGDFLDKATKGKKIVTTIAIIIAAITTTMVVWTSNFWAILVGKTLEGISSTIFLPALMSLLLGISKTDAEVPSFIATTEVSNKVGSFLIVSACAAISYFAYPNIEAMFYLLGAGGLAAAFFTFIIPESAIDHNRARQLGDTEDESVETENDLNKSLEIELAEDQAVKANEATPSRYLELLGNRDIMFFAVLTFTYHLANAGPAPLLAQYVASITSEQASLTWTSAILIAYFLPQAMTAYLMSYAVDRFSHKRIMIVAFVTVPARCFAIALMVEYFQNPWALTASQALEGIGAGVYDVMIPIIVQQLTKGTGRFGFTFGFIVSMWRIGHGSSVFLAELLVQSFNYTVSFSTLGSIGILNLIVFVLFFKLDTENKSAKNNDNTSNRQVSSTHRRMSSESAESRTSFIAAGSSSMCIIEPGGEESNNEIGIIQDAKLAAEASMEEEVSDEEIDEEIDQF